MTRFAQRQLFMSGREEALAVVRFGLKGTLVQINVLLIEIAPLALVDWFRSGSGVAQSLCNATSEMEEISFIAG